MMSRVITMKQLIISCCLIIGGFLGVQLLAPASASAAVYTITATSNEDSGEYGSDPDPDTGCSLREAAIALNYIVPTAYGGCPAVDSSGNEIRLPGGTYDLGGVGFYYYGAHGSLTITGNATTPSVLLGGSNTLELVAGWNNSITITNLTVKDSVGDAVAIYTTGSLTITNLTLQNAGGIILNNNQTATLANILVDGATGLEGFYHSNSTGQVTTATNLTIRNSTTAVYHGAWDGVGKLYLNNAHIYDNDGVGVYNYECAVATPASLYITNSYIHHNAGSGVYNQCGHVSLTNTTIAYNQATSGYGGGIYSRSGLVADDSVAGAVPTYVDMTNVTIYGNTAGIAGGGIYLADSNVGALPHSYTWKNVTIAGNEAPEGSGIFIASSGGATQRPELINALVVNNTGAAQCGSNATVAFGATSANNLVTDTTCGASASAINGAGLLEDTLTHEGTQAIGFNGEVLGVAVLKLLPNSPAMTGGQLCPSADAVGRDRPTQDCSIGAYQFVLAGSNGGDGDGGSVPSAPNTGLAGAATSSSLLLGGVLIIGSGFVLSRLRTAKTRRSR